MTAQYVLIGIGKCTQGIRRVLDDDMPIVIGRHSECAVVIREGAMCPDLYLVSRQHAVLEIDANRWTVHDTGSENGTAVLAGGLPPAIRLDPGVPHVLHSEDVIELAGVIDFSFRFAAHAS